MHPAATRAAPIQIRPESVEESGVLTVGGVVRFNNPFEIVHYYDWFFDQRGGENGEGEWLPDLGKLNHTPGANGVALINGRVNPAGARAGVIQKGGILISQGDRRLGPEPEYIHYLAAYPAKTKYGQRGKYHIYSWVRFTILGGGRAVPDAVANAPKTRAFHRRVYEAGIVPMMPRELLDEKIAIHRARLQNTDSKFGKGQLDAATHKRILSENEAQIEQWTRGFDVLHGGATATTPTALRTTAAAPSAVATPSDIEPTGDAISPIKPAPRKKR